MTGWLHRRLLGWVETLRFPWLLLLTGMVFAINVAIPDIIPFIDEILLGLATLVLSRMRRKPAPKKADEVRGSPS